MFEKAKDKLARVAEEVERRKRIIHMATQIEALEKSNDSLLQQIVDLLDDEEEADVRRLYVERYAAGLREGYQTGVCDGAHQATMDLAKQLHEQGVPFELKDWKL